MIVILKMVIKVISKYSECMDTVCKRPKQRSMPLAPRRGVCRTGRGGAVQAGLVTFVRTR